MHISMQWHTVIYTAQTHSLDTTIETDLPDTVLCSNLQSQLAAAVYQKIVYDAKLHQW